MASIPFPLGCGNCLSLYLSALFCVVADTFVLIKSNHLILRKMNSTISPEELMRQLRDVYGYEVDMEYARVFIRMTPYADAEGFHCWLMGMT